MNKEFVMSIGTAAMATVGATTGVVGFIQSRKMKKQLVQLQHQQDILNDIIQDIADTLYPDPAPAAETVVVAE